MCQFLVSNKFIRTHTANKMFRQPKTCFEHGTFLQTRMRSHPDAWCFVGPFAYSHTLCVRTAKALAKLRGCSSSPESSLVAYMISTIISWAGSFISFSDPYVKIYLLYNGQRIAKKKTHVKKRTLNPVFNESFLFDVPYNEGLQNISLEFLVLDWDRMTKNEVVGRLEIGARTRGPQQHHWNEVMNCPRKQIAEWHKLSDWTNYRVKLKQTNVLSHVTRLWYFSSSVNSCFKRTCPAIQGC